MRRLRRRHVHDPRARRSRRASPALPVVLSPDVPGTRRPLCDAPGVPPGLFTGKIVACQRGVNARVEKGFNVLRGGAAGMILYNPALADVETDNHWLPTVHLADGTAFVAFMAATPARPRRSPQASRRTAQGDVMAAFSSRGPAGLSSSRTSPHPASRSWPA